MKTLLVIVDTEQGNQAALNTFFEGYESRPVARGAWVVKTALSPKDFNAKLIGEVSDLVPTIIPVERDAFTNGVLTAGVSGFLGIPRAA